MDITLTLTQWAAAFDSQAKAFLVATREALALMEAGGRVIALTYAEASRTGGVQPWVAMGSAKAARIDGAVFRRDRRQTRDHRERHQPRMD
jgi:enoyl-[acyl-carrier-protein] reductase (NADH)